MTRRVKQVLIGGGVLFGLVFFLLAGTLVYLSTDHAQRLIQSKVNKKIPGKIVFENLRFSTIKSEFELTHVVLQDPSEEAIAGFDRLFVDFSWFPLLKGILRIKALVLQKPWAEVQVDQDGQANILRAFSFPKPEEEKQEREGAVPNIVLESVNITEGSVRYEMVAPALKVGVRGLHLAGGADFPGQSGELSIEIDSTKLDGPTTEATVSNFKLAAVGPLDNPHMSLHLDLEAGSLGERPIDAATLACHLEDRLLRLDELKIDVAGGEVVGTGEADLKEAFPRGFLSSEGDPESISYNVILEGKAISAGTLLDVAGHLTGKANTVFSLEGKGISPENVTARASLEITGHEFGGDGVANPISAHLRAEASLDHGTATLNTLEAEAGEMTIQSNGHFSLSSKEMGGKLMVDAPNLDRTLGCFGLKEAGGSLNIRADISGSTRRPVFDFALQGIQLQFQDIAIGDVGIVANLDPSSALQGRLSLHTKGLAKAGTNLGDARVELRLSEGTLHLDQGEVRNQNSLIEVSGTAQVFEPDALRPPQDPAFGLQVKGDTIFIQDFTDQFKGRLSLSAELQGRLTEPHGTIEVHATGLDLGIQKIHELTLRSRLEGDKVWFDPLQVTVSEGEVLEAKGWLSREKAFDVSLTSKGISLRNLDKVREQDVAEGIVLIDISAKGSVKDPQIKGEVAVNQAKLMGKPFDDFRVHLDVHDQTATVTGNLNFQVNGSYHLQSRDFSADVLFQDTDLGPYFRMADSADLGGTLAGKIVLEGNANTLDQARGSVQLSKLDILFKEEELVHAEGVEASFTHDELSISDLNMVLHKAGHIQVNGRGERKGPLAFEVDAHIPLSVMRLFVEEVPDIEGDMLVSGRVGGTWTRPEIRGDLELKEVEFTAPVLLQKIHQVNGRVEVTPQRVTVHGIEGKLDSGRFDLAGTIDLKGLEPTAVNLNLNGEMIPLQWPDTMDLLVTTGLRAHGTQEKSVIEGEIVILEGTYYRDVKMSLLEAVSEKKREGTAAPEEMEEPFLRNMMLDISVKNRGPLVVQNNLADMDINSDLRITGKLNNPVVRGRAEVTAGTVKYRNKNFVVKRGVVDFLNPYVTEATTDIESEVKVRHWLITLVISGTPDALTLELNSDPPEEDGDILSLLVIGRTTGELINGEGGTSKSSSQMLAEAMSSTFGEDIKEATGLDILETETGDEDEPDRVQVTVGEELSKRMTVKYAVESKDGEIIQRAIGEYKLLENVSAEGFQDTRGVFGGQVQFRLEFR